MSQKTDVSKDISNSEAYGQSQGTYAAGKPLHSTSDNSDPAQLDGTPVYPTGARPPPVNMVEMADTSTAVAKNKHLISPSSTASESPVLGRGSSGSYGISNQTLRHHHMMSWNNYDDMEAVSPPSSMSAGLSPMNVSPPGASPGDLSNQWYKPSQRRS